MKTFDRYSIFGLRRLLSLEDRFHDLEGQHTRTARSDKQKYEEYIVGDQRQRQKRKLHFD